MHVHKQFVTDEEKRPVAVLIPYDEWLEIERRLNLAREESSRPDLMRHAGQLKLEQDPLQFQHEIRGEWP